MLCQYWVPASFYITNAKTNENNKSCEILVWLNRTLFAMMENKCNKTPNKYLDHVYCQPGEGKNYMRPSNGTDRTGGGTSANVDIIGLLKENKQLKAMLILHLDLIQEQSDQLLAKDREVCGLKEELQTAQTKNAQIETQLKELKEQLQVQQSQQPIKNQSTKYMHSTPTTCFEPSLGERALLSPPPLAKIQCNKENSLSPTNIIGECNGKLITKIILQRVSLPDGKVIETHCPPYSTAISVDTVTDQQHLEEQEQELEEGIEEMLTTDSDDGTIETVKEKINESTTKQDSSSSVTLTASVTPTLQVCVTPPTPSRGKQMPLMLWHAPNIHSEGEESGSGDESTADIEQQENNDVPESSTSIKPKRAEPAKTKGRKAAQQSQSGRQQSQRSSQGQQNVHKHKRRCVYITTEQLYATREWETEDETVCDYEFSQAEAEALHADAPMLEIPKWTEHELSPSYCIEGTEDLSEESFVKRHAKLEVDEKRRKKWDVQQIREQRRIEKLKRRHCKNEVQTNEPQMLKSFYPQPENLQTICFVNELPVQAFGEIIPKLSTTGEFVLPWLQGESSATNSKTTTTSTNITTTTSTATATSTETTLTNTTITNSSSVEIMANSTASSTSANAQAQILKSSFVFLKKRKRQQCSSSGGGTSNRQRTSTAAKVTPQSSSSSGTAITTPASKTANAVETETPVEESVNNTVEEKK